MSPDRWAHFLFAIMCAGIYAAILYARHGKASTSRIASIALAFPFLFLGSAVPDFDITLFGIGGHRNILFHSALPYFAFAWLSNRTSYRSEILTAVKIAFALGLGSHLIMDFPQGRIVGMPTSFLDPLWLLGNGIAVVLVSVREHGRGVRV